MYKTAGTSKIAQTLRNYSGAQQRRTYSISTVAEGQACEFTQHHSAAEGNALNERSVAGNTKLVGRHLLLIESATKMDRGPGVSTGRIAFIEVEGLTAGSI